MQCSITGAKVRADPDPWSLVVATDHRRRPPIGSHRLNPLTLFFAQEYRKVAKVVSEEKA